jgi:hypothetical protein
MLSPEDRALKHNVGHFVSDTYRNVTDFLSLFHVQQMYSFVSKNTASFWSRSFLDDLRRVCSCLLTDRPPHIHLSDILSAYQNAKSRLLLFDYDVSTVRNMGFVRSRLT